VGTNPLIKLLSANFPENAFPLINSKRTGNEILVNALSKKATLPIILKLLRKVTLTKVVPENGINSKALVLYQF
jgi:hypothetical protein